MKVALLFYEPNHSGQGTHVLSLARGLDRRKYELLVIAPEANSYTVQALQQAGARAIPFALSKWGGAGTVLRLARLFRHEQVDLLHVHSQEAGLYGRLAGKLVGVPRIVYTPQTIDIRRKRWQRLYWQAERLLGFLTDAVISVNAADRQRLIDLGLPADKVSVIYNGIEAGPWMAGPQREEAREKFGLAGDVPLVLQVGRLSAQKDPLMLLRAAARVVQQQPKAQFWLAGAGPMEKQVRDTALFLDVQDNIRCLGWRSDVPELLAVSSVVTLSSLWEGTPYALLEAMAACRPVVATAVNGSSEVVVDGETGYLVPPGDERAMAQRIVQLLDDPARAKLMGQEGRRRVAELFTVDRMVEQVTDLYNRLVCSG